MAKKASKWIDFQKQSAEEINIELLTLENEKAYNKCTQDISNAKESLSQKKADLAAAERAKPFSAVIVLNAQRQLALATKDVEDLKAVRERLFDPIQD